MHRNLLVLAAALVMQATALEAGAACTAGNPNLGVIESTPTSDFTNIGTGTATHALTGLMWKRCPEGLSGASCSTGTAAAMTWRAALLTAVADTTAGYSDWRLPNKKELESVVETCGQSPSINRSVFPGTLPLYFWSATTYVRDPDNAWFVQFNSGSSSDYFKTSNFAVRLVRGGQYPDALDISAKATVVEYLNSSDFPNSPGGHFFYSSDPAEQAAIDQGAAGAFFRTNRQFLTGGTSPVCRFYGSIRPGPNSHFFTVDSNECNALKAAQVIPTPSTTQQWNSEGMGYSTTPVTVAANGARSCPIGTQPLYRAYNNAYTPSGAKNPWDSNHRFTLQAADIATMLASGWRDEGIVFCTTL